MQLAFKIADEGACLSGSINHRMLQTNYTMSIGHGRVGHDRVHN